MWRVDDCFTHGCVICCWMCQSFLLECIFFHHSFWPCRYEFFDLSLPVGDKFF